jgi:type 1 glutamine amidotransferase
VAATRGDPAATVASDSLAYQWLVRGQFGAHPGDLVPHRVVFDGGSPSLGDMPPVDLATERYVMLVDPAVAVHARTTIGADPLPWLEGVQVPVASTHRWGAGRVGYGSTMARRSGGPVTSSGDAVTSPRGRRG